MSRENISVSFTREQAEFLASLVEQGKYQSFSEAVRAAIRPFQHHHAVLEAEIARARGEIEIGAQDLDQGRSVDAEAFFARWDAELDRLEVESRSEEGCE